MRERERERERAKMIPSLGIRKKLMLVLLAMLVPLALFTALTFYNEQKLNHEIENLQQKYNEIQLVSNLQLTIAKALMPANDYIITGNMEYLEDFNKVSSEMEQLVASLRLSFSDKEKIHDVDGEATLKNELISDWKNIKTTSLKIFKIKNPAGNKTATNLMKEMDYKYGYPAISRLDEWHRLEQIQMFKVEARLESLTHRNLIGTIISLIIVTGIGVLFAFFISGRFTSAIKKLQKETAAIAGGAFKGKIELNTNDELSSLAHDINQMSGALEKSYSQLEEKIAERTKELAESEEKYRVMIELSSEHIWSLDSDGNITFANKRAEEALNYTLAEIVGKPYQPLIPKNELPAVTAAIQKALGDEEVSFETTVLKKNGGSISTVATVTPIKKNGRITGVLGFSRDITAIKSAEEALSERVNELERFRKATLQREVRMKELRDKIKGLEQALKTSTLGA